MKRTLVGCLLTLLLVSANLARGPELFPKPSPNSANEPLAETMSLDRAAEFLEGVAMTWIRERKCGTCHTTFPYLMARLTFGDETAPALLQMRAFHEHRVAHWDSGIDSDKPPRGLRRGHRGRRDGRPIGIR